uniref:DUF38 domain-containing protein n=1 Tax=Panagrolaimus sp. JU765 TaxID=591449 RepID=A0AC34RMX2_9BILA
MIADEIVHNSIPEDRIQFATTCKAFNQLVKHAKPKKIIRELHLGRHKTELEKFLQQYQVENLLLDATIRYIDERFYSELMDLLVESCWSVTELSITSHNPEFKYVDFYTNLKHLKSLTIYDTTRMIRNLPYFPPKLNLLSEYSLSLLAEKTFNHPLSFLEIGHEVQLTQIQQFLMAANLEIGAEIRFCFKNQQFANFDGFLTFIGNGLFEFQLLRGFEYLMLNQQMNSQNKKILKLLTYCYFVNDRRIPFTVTSVPNPDNVICSGEFTYKIPKKIISENVAECVKVMSPYYSTYYSPQLLENWFPRTENYDPFERVKTINETLGTKIVIIKPEMLEERWVRNQYLPNRTSNPIHPEWLSQKKRKLS